MSWIDPSFQDFDNVSSQFKSKKQSFLISSQFPSQSKGKGSSQHGHGLPSKSRKRSNDTWADKHTPVTQVKIVLMAVSSQLF